MALQPGTPVAACQHQLLVRYALHVMLHCSNVHPRWQQRTRPLHWPYKRPQNWKERGWSFWQAKREESWFLELTWKFKESIVPRVLELKERKEGLSLLVKKKTKGGCLSFGEATRNLFLFSFPCVFLYIPHEFCNHGFVTSLIKKGSHLFRSMLFLFNLNMTYVIPIPPYSCLRIYA